MTPLASILLASVAESVVSFTGGVLAIFGVAHFKRVAHFLTSFAIGALLGVAFLELIPEASEMASLEVILPWVLGGVLLFFLLEKAVVWYHYHTHQTTHAVHSYTYLILVGDFLHNFVDGIILALAFLVDVKLGIATTIAVMLHEIPQEISDFGVLIHGGMHPRRALFYNFLVSLSTIFGAVLTYLLGNVFAPFLPFALALIAGNFLYLAMTDLLPELHEHGRVSHTLVHLALIVAGIILVILPEMFFPHASR